MKTVIAIVCAMVLVGCKVPESNVAAVVAAPVSENSAVETVESLAAKVKELEETLKLRDTILQRQDTIINVMQSRVAVYDADNKVLRDNCKEFKTPAEVAGK
jgi:hypothetical protein